jgi:hypothetical protein
VPMREKLRIPRKRSCSLRETNWRIFAGMVSLLRHPEGEHCSVDTSLPVRVTSALVAHGTVPVLWSVAVTPDGVNSGMSLELYRVGLGEGNRWTGE